jgi:hypothetical protein
VKTFRKTHRKRKKLRKSNERRMQWTQKCVQIERERLQPRNGAAVFLWFS